MRSLWSWISRQQGYPRAAMTGAVTVLVIGAVGNAFRIPSEGLPSIIDLLIYAFWFGIAGAFLGVAIWQPFAIHQATRDDQSHGPFVADWIHAAVDRVNAVRRKAAPRRKRL